MIWVATGSMTAVLLGALGAMSFWVARSLDVLGQGLRDLRADMGGLETSVRADMGGLEANLRADMGRLETGLRADIGRLETGLRADIGRLETALRSDISDLRGDLRRLETKVFDDHGERIARLEARSGL